MNAGKTILITGGGGGVGSAAIQIAKKVLGLVVIGTASRAETVNFSNSCGADHVISHRESFAPQLEKLGIEAVDYVFHCSDLTPALFTEFIETVKPFGGIVSIWPSASVDLMLLFWKSINFSAELMFTRPGMKTNPDQMLRQHEILNEICRLVEEGTLFSTKTMTKDMTVDNLRTLLEMQASGEAIGKMTLCFE